MHCCREDAIGLSLQELTDIADESIWDRWSVNPYTVLVEDFKGRDGILED